MMKKIILLTLVGLMCGLPQIENQMFLSNYDTKEGTDIVLSNYDQKGRAEMKKIDIIIDNQEFQVDLYENETVYRLLEKLPLTIQMNELHGNEKYNYLDFNLPTNAESIGYIKAGDLMLFGNNCLVLFYESFSSSYEYTKLGHVNDTNGLMKALGNGNVEVTIKMDN